MKTVTISKRLVFLIVCSVIALLIVGGVGLSAALHGQRGVTQVRDDSLASIKTLGNARNSFQQIRVNAYTHVLTTDDAGMAEVEKRMDELIGGLNGELKKYESMASNDEDRKLLEADRQDVSRYLAALHDKLLPLSRKNETNAALNVLRNEMRPMAVEAGQALDKHVAFNENMANSYANEVVGTVSAAIKWSIASIVVAVVLIAVMGYFMLVNIRGSLGLIRDSVTQVEANLDFTQRVKILREDEIGVTAQALNRLLDKLQSNLKTILTHSETVAQSASQMSTTSGQVAIASHQQSESASNMAATVEEMTVSINHVGDRAHEADRISTESGQLAASGETIIGKTVHDINKISETVNQAAERIRELVDSSQQISNVVAVIKEVADQTNLLALNAAIEAARAGEQGRGFAVVADEVRKLAERTATSTQEISATIESMRTGASDAAVSMESVVNEVSLGVESAQKASEAINQIGNGSRSAVEMVEEITSAIREQASAMTTIAQQVERIAQMSEESSAAADHSAQVATDLDHLATEMQRIVGAYRL